VAIGEHVEHSLIPLHELGLDAEALPDRSRQTGGPRSVVSTHAVVDLHPHAAHLAGAK